MRATTLLLFAGLFVNSVAEAKTCYRDMDGDRYGSILSKTFSSPICPIGWSSRSGDCNNRDSEIYPGADELCDGVDNDCDGTTDLDPITGEGDWLYTDSDGDGLGSSYGDWTCTSTGYSTSRDDCDDGDATVGDEEVTWTGSMRITVSVDEDYGGWLEDCGVYFWEGGEGSSGDRDDFDLDTAVTPGESVSEVISYEDLVETGGTFECEATAFLSCTFYEEDDGYGDGRPVGCDLTDFPTTITLNVEADGSYTCE